MPGQTQPGQANLDNIVFHNLVNAVANANGADYTNPFAKGLTVVVDITAATAATLTVTIEGKDPVSGKYYTILASAGLTTVGTTVLKVYPALAVTANLSANAPLPKTYRVRVTVAGTVTAKIGGALHL